MRHDKDSCSVSVAGRSWESATPGLYCFEATVDGMPIELSVAEDVAFEFLQAWTPCRVKCLEILRLHRVDLARALERKIRHGYRPGEKPWLLTSDDIARVWPAAGWRAQAAGLRVVLAGG